MEYGGLKFTSEPQLSDYYKPSKEMQEYETIFVQLLAWGGSYAPHEFILVR